MNKNGKLVYACVISALGCMAFVQQASADYLCTAHGTVDAVCSDGSTQYGWVGHETHGEQNYFTTHVDSVSGCDTRCDVAAAFFTSADPFSASGVGPGTYSDPIGGVPADMVISCYCD